MRLRDLFSDGAQVLIHRLRGLLSRVYKGIWCEFFLLLFERRVILLTLSDSYLK